MAWLPSCRRSAFGSRITDLRRTETRPKRRRKNDPMLRLNLRQTKTRATYVRPPTASELGMPDFFFRRLAGIVLSEHGMSGLRLRPQGAWSVHVSGRARKKDPASTPKIAKNVRTRDLGSPPTFQGPFRLRVAVTFFPKTKIHYPTRLTSEWIGDNRRRVDAQY